MRSVPLLLAAWLTLPSLSLAATPEELTALDGLFARRGDAAALQQLDEALSKALEATPEDYELLWRSARARQWQADGAADAKLKKVLGKQAWDLGDRARKAAPERVEGHFYAAAGVGLHAQAVGVLTALNNGLEGKFNERLDKALQLEPMFERGGPLLAKARYYYELPWPKRDLKKSAELCRQVADKHPEMLRAWLFLAETLLKDGQEKEAQAALLKVTQGSVTFDPPEGQRTQSRAKKVQEELEKALK